MTNPEVNHGTQPPVNPEVVVSGPLGETTVRVGGQQVYPAPEPDQPEDAPDEPQQAPEPEQTEEA